MIDKIAIKKFVEDYVADTDYFFVDITVSKNNEIVVEIDSYEGVDIDYCVALTRAIEGEFNRDEEDYELEVGSAGLTSPFKVIEQYKKNIGNEVEVLTKEGKKLKGTLDQVSEDEFTVMVSEKVKKEGEKRPVIEDVEYKFKYNQVKYTKYFLQF